MKMHNLIIVFLGIFSCSLCVNTEAAILFQDNFDSSSNWTVTQPTGTATSCSSNCGIPGNWTGYYNGASYCTGIDAPGNNLLYINQYAGYPSETNACHGGSGKCLTVWLESCRNADDSDGQITKLLDQEYEELYVRWYIRFKKGYKLRRLINGDGSITKLYHIQHYLDGSPHAYFGNNPGNQPVSSGGMGQYENTIQFYAEARCQNTYYCHNVMIWNLGSVSWAYAPGGIYDGNWHSMELRIKRNSSIGARDGLLEFWLDGVKKAPLSGYPNNDIAWNDSGSSELRGFRYVMLAGNTNNQFETNCSNMADCEQWYAIDDVVISTTYVGTGSTGVTPPRNLQLAPPSGG